MEINVEVIVEVIEIKVEVKVEVIEIKLLRFLFFFFLWISLANTSMSVKNHNYLPSRATNKNLPFYFPR